MKTTRIHLRFVLPAVACVIVSACGAQAAGEDEVLTQLRQFSYGRDPAPLTNVERMVATVTANASDSSARQKLAESLAAILETDASYEAKQFVCRQLAIIGTARQVPVLAKLLTDDQLSDMARYALGAIPDRAVDAALRPALDRTRGPTQLGIINTLGFRRDRAAVRQLGRALNGADRAVAKAAAAALGRIGGAEAASLLQRMLPTTTGDLHLSVAEAYLACAEGLVAQNEGERAMPLYWELFQQGQPASVRAAALRGLATASGAEGVRFALSSLRDAEPLVKRVALGCVQMLPGHEATRQFAAELPTLPPPDQVVLLGALANRGDAAALPAVTVAAKSAEAPVKIAALEALGKLGDASVVNLLVASAASGSPAESQAALNSLRTLGGEGTDEAIARKLEDAPGLRAALIRVLADRQAVSAVPALTRMAADPDERISIESFKALGQLADAASVPELLKLLGRVQTDAVREAAEAAVTEVSRRMTDEARQAEPVLAALREGPSEPVRCSLLRVLAGIGNAPALAAVQSAVQDPSGVVRDAAVRALADWPNPVATQVLLDVFRNSQDPTQRILLLRGLVRLMGLESGRTPAQTWNLCKQVMQQARGTDEVRQALSLLATVSDPQALALVEPYLKDDSVREEAAMTAVKIAGPLAATHRDLARQTIEAVLAVSQNATVRQQANTVLQSLEKNEDFVTAWQLAGPFLENGKSAKEIFDVPFPPETGDKSTVWRPITAQGVPPIVDLLSVLGGTQRAAYLRTWIHSDQTQPARLELGSDDGVKAWLNGAVVHANNADRGLVVGQDKVPVTLQAGWNRLLLKITQGEGGWAACARLRTPNGHRLEHVRFDSAHQETAPPAR